jgi:L-iditol 2-dehydrogenase
LLKAEIKSEVKEDARYLSDLMNAFLFYGPRDIRFERVPMPKISDDEILVKVKAALTCGTDLKTFQRGHPVLIKSLPSTFGHQFSGVVVKAGEAVTNFCVGQNVVALNSAPCYSCVYCKSGKYNLCENIEFLNGAYAEYIALPRRIVRYNTYEIPQQVSYEAAAILESLSVVLHGFEKSEITIPKTVCIIGAGSIGLLFTALCKLQGIKVICIGRKENKLKLAREIGAYATLNLNNFSNIGNLAYALKDLTSSLGPDVVIEAVGLPETWELATNLVAKGGLVNFFGGCKKGTQVKFDTYRLHYDELKLIGVFHHTPKHVISALELLSNKSFNTDVLEKIITHSLPLEELEKAFLMHESGEAIQVAISP